MEEIIRETEPALWLSKLKDFNTANANAFTFVDRFGEDTKRNFIQSLFDILKNPDDKRNTVDGMASMLTAIRLCLREPIAIEPLDNKEHVSLIIKYAGLDGQATKITDEVQEEACKCIVNLVAKNQTIENLFVAEFDGPRRIFDLLKKGATAGVTFPLCRVLLHVSLSGEVAQSLVDMGLMELLTDMLAQHVGDISELRQLEAGSPRVIAIGEILKVLFNLTLSLGPLGGGYPADPTDQDVARFHRLLPLYRNILCVYGVNGNAETPLLQLKLNVVNCLLNTPRPMIPIIVDDANYATLNALIGILAVQVQAAESESEALTPILMLLTMIAEDVKQTRDILKRFVFPKDVLENASTVTVEGPEALKDEPTVAGKLIPHMTTLDIALKHYVNEFFYMICDEDANEVCRLTGFGNAAGLLVMRGLMKLGNAPPKKKSSTALSSVSSTSSSQPIPPPRPDETEEEKEERLATQFQKLVDEGVIQLVRNEETKKEDPDSD
jgi:hypothetical protein